MGKQRCFNPSGSQNHVRRPRRTTDQHQNNEVRPLTLQRIRRENPSPNAPSSTPIPPITYTTIGFNNSTMLGPGPTTSNMSNTTRQEVTSNPMPGSDYTFLMAAGIFTISSFLVLGGVMLGRRCMQNIADDEDALLPETPMELLPPSYPAPPPYSGRSSPPPPYPDGSSTPLPRPDGPPPPYTPHP